MTVPRLEHLVRVPKMKTILLFFFSMILYRSSSQSLSEKQRQPGDLYVPTECKKPTSCARRGTGNFVACGPYRENSNCVIFCLRVLPRRCRPILNRYTYYSLFRHCYSQCKVMRRTVLRLRRQDPIRAPAIVGLVHLSFLGGKVRSGKLIYQEKAICTCYFSRNNRGKKTRYIEGNPPRNCKVLICGYQSYSNCHYCLWLGVTCPSHCGGRRSSMWQLA